MVLTGKLVNKFDPTADHRGGAAFITAGVMYDLSTIQSRHRAPEIFSGRSSFAGWGRRVMMFLPLSIATLGKPAETRSAGRIRFL